MLGDDIVVAPVVAEGATSREVYLPSGNWELQRQLSLESSKTSTLKYVGPTLLEKVDAPLDTLLWFRRCL